MNCQKPLEASDISDIFTAIVVKSTTTKIAGTAIISVIIGQTFTVGLLTTECVLAGLTTINSEVVGQGLTGVVSAQFKTITIAITTATG